MRLPGTLNRKDQRNGQAPVPCELAECHPDRRYPFAAFGFLHGRSAAVGQGQRTGQGPLAGRQARSPPPGSTSWPTSSTPARWPRPAGGRTAISPCAATASAKATTREPSGTRCRRSVSSASAAVRVSRLHLGQGRSRRSAPNCTDGPRRGRYPPPTPRRHRRSTPSAGPLRGPAGSPGTAAPPAAEPGPAVGSAIERIDDPHRLARLWLRLRDQRGRDGALPCRLFPGTVLEVAWDALVALPRRRDALPGEPFL